MHSQLVTIRFFHETMVPGLLPIAIELESDRLANLKIDSEALYIERQVVFEERRLRTENSPDGRMQEAVWSLVFKSHPYRAPVIGYEEDLKAYGGHGSSSLSSRSITSREI